MKYEIVKNGIDDYSLKYKEKEIKLKSDVETITKLQGIYKEAKKEMIFDLSKEGKTIKELCKETKKDGKTYIDNSNETFLLNMYVEDISAKLFNEAIKKVSGATLEELCKEIGLEDKEQEEFAKELGEVIAGRFQNKGQK